MGPVRLGGPKNGPKGEGAHDTSSDPTSEPGNPEATTPHPGTGDQGDSGTQGAGNGPARIGADKPVDIYEYSGPALLGESKDFGQLQTKGRRVDDELHTAIKDNTPDVPTDKLSESYVEGNRDQNLVLSDSKDKDLEEPLREIGMDFKAKYSSNSIFSAGAPPSQGVVAEGKFFDQDKTIVGENRFAANDINPPDKKMRPSDIVFAQWKSFATHRNSITKDLKKGMTDDVDKLENFVGRNIQSKSAVETLYTAHKNTNQPPDKPGVFKRDSQGAEKDAFNALLGTDSLSSINYMLKDHHQALGNKRVSEIHTYLRTYNLQTEEGRQKIAIAAKFEEYKP